VGMVGLWIHGSLALSMVKAVDKLLLNIVALAKGSVIIFPSGDLSEMYTLVVISPCRHLVVF